MFLNTCKTTMIGRSAVLRNRKEITRLFNVQVHNNKTHVGVSPAMFSLKVRDNIVLDSFRTNNPRKLLLNKFASSSAPLSCWNCGKSKVIDNSVDALFCEHCNVIQRPSVSKNYFEVIGVEERYDIDETLLSKKYKDLQKLLHPDKYSHKSKAEQEISGEYSSLVNKAYSTLLQPLSRGMYMLKQNGHYIPEETQVESAFLHQIMERNEQVEEASTPEEVMKINSENKIVISELVAKLSVAFSNGDYITAKDILIHMKYYISIDNQIKELIRKMGIVQ